MCGAIGRVTDNPFVKNLMNMLNIQFDTLDDNNIRPNASIPISIGTQNGPSGVMANWWLFQARKENGYTYDARYKSFNTRKEKLFSNRKQDFANHRCVIPASCFYEWKGFRYKVEAVDRAIAFGGLYKTWPAISVDQNDLFTQQELSKSPHYSCSIITLPAHSRFSHIHDKSLPLMLLPNEIEPWLDTSFSDTDYWLPSIQSKIRFDLQVTPVDKKNPDKAVGASEIIKADVH